MAWAEEPGELRWAPPVPCRGCGQPMPRALELCPRCGEPQGLAPGLRARRLAQRWAWLPDWLARRAADATLAATLLGLGALLLPWSPLLVLFPLLLVGPDLGRPREERPPARGPHPRSPRRPGPGRRLRPRPLPPAAPPGPGSC